MKTAKTNQEKVIDFVLSNPKSDVSAIGKATKLKGVLLFSTIKKLVGEGRLNKEGDKKEATYTVNQIIPEHFPTEEKEKGGKKLAGKTKEKSDVKEETASEPETGEKEKPNSGRDTTKYKFNGAEYGKGPLVLAVVKKYVEDKPKTTLPQLLKAFPPELLNRFGIVAEVKEAQKLSGERSRYFLKPEQIIKLKDGKSVAVCNQFTSETIKPFLKVAKEFGYSIR